jgi:hypothetical protein
LFLRTVFTANAYNPGMLAALGFRAHSGWAVLIGIAEPVSAPRVVLRRRIETADANIAGSRQPYHAAEGLAFAKAERLIQKCLDSSRRLARAAVEDAVRELQVYGHVTAACGAILSSGRPLPALESILASHALIHAAEGELFRNVVVEAAERCKLQIIGVKAKELVARCQGELASTKHLEEHLSVVGRTLGPPWRQDEKLATLAAWLALAACRQQTQLAR